MLPANNSGTDMTMTPKRPEPLLPKLPVSIIQGLIRIYGRLQGEIDKTSDGRQRLIEQDQAKEIMGHIEGLMPLSGIDFDPTAVKSIRTRVRTGPLKHGELRHGALTALKKNAGFMTYREIMNFIITKHRLKLSIHEQTQLLQSVKTAMFFLFRIKEVERESELDSKGGNDELQRFRLSLSKYRQSS